MSSHPLISVVIPAFNAAGSLEETLRSVINQSWRNIEILVVDDGSADNTRELVEALADRDPRVRLFRQKNCGVAAARNLAIRHAAGEFIAPVDADDLWHPDKLAKQLQRFESAPPAVGLVYCWFDLIDADGKKIGVKKPDLEGNVFEPILLRNFLENSSIPLIRTQVLREAGGYDEHFIDHKVQGCEDWGLYVKIAAKHEFAVLPETLMQYRISARSMSHNVESMERSRELIIENLLKQGYSIPPRSLKWSKSKFYLYLLNRGSNDFRCLFKYWKQGMRIDPLSFLSPWIFSLFARCGLNSIFRSAPVSRLCRRSRMAERTLSFLRDRYRSLRNAIHDTPLIHLFKPHNKLFEHRWKNTVSHPEIKRGEFPDQKKRSRSFELNLPASPKIGP